MKTPKSKEHQSHQSIAKPIGRRVIGRAIGVLVAMTLSNIGVNSSQAVASESRSLDGNTDIWTSFQNTRTEFRKAEIDEATVWKRLVELNPGLSKLSPDKQSMILQTQAMVLMTSGYPILAAINAAQAIIKSPTPYDDELNRSWKILREVSLEHPVQNILISVAEKIRTAEKSVPVFADDWNYILGSVRMTQKKYKEALALLAKVKTTDRYFFPAKYQQGMIFLAMEDRKSAVQSLKSIINSTSQGLSTLKADERIAITADANMALGRIYYEESEFQKAMVHYRRINKDSVHFYDSLFEQSWALFMAGYPNHALGMLYSVRSPFFVETFKPEATMLASIIYYWMCRYDDARGELADFIELHEPGIKSLNEFLARKDLTPLNLYTWFENTVTGVSSESLGIPRSLLASAAEQDAMMHVRDQYASVLGELQRLGIKGIFGDSSNLSIPRQYLEEWAQELKKDIGEKFLTELTEMKKDFDRLRDQSQFLYVELLMSQKDQLLGKELHKDSKLAKLSIKENISGWSRQSQIWATDDKMEYWQDELGFHIFRMEPLCKD